MTQSEKQYFKTKISALRKAIETLEMELGADVTPTPSRKKSRMQQFEENYAAGTWRKPMELRKTKR